LELQSVRLNTGRGDFSIEVHPSSDHLYVRADVADVPTQRVVSRAPDDDAALILAALEGLPDGAVYREAAASALALVET
jgi:hypothetical protein